MLNFYEESKAFVRVVRQRREQQESGILPWLLSIFMDRVVREVKAKVIDQRESMVQSNERKWVVAVCG